jgi:hypothetical protein
LPFATRRDFRNVVSLPFDFELVFSAERPVNTIPMMSFALGQKGRCKMKLSKIPMFVTSLFGLGLVSGLDGPPVYADFTFGDPTNLGVPVNSSYAECMPSISADGLSLYFNGWSNNRPNGYGEIDIWLSTRDSIDDDWGEPVNAGPAINTSGKDYGPCISPDGLALYFTANRVGGYGTWDLWVTTRATTEDLWGEPNNLGPMVNSESGDVYPSLSADGLSLYFTSNRAGGYGIWDLWMTTRETTSDPWGEPVNLGPTVNSPYRDMASSISSDGRVLFFWSIRSAGEGDIWMTTRATTQDDWEPAVKLEPPINTLLTEDATPNLSADGSTLYFASNRLPSQGGIDLYQVPIIPIVDFNGDGQVNGKEVLRMVSRWSTDDPVCDIGPFAWGDGIVDPQDLIVLADYIGKEVADPALIAHWALDETEGTTTRETISGEDAYVLGGALWQPTGGQVNGALQLDGVDDFVMTSPVVNLAEGPFSVFVWVSGGAPGQVVVAESSGVSLLCTDPVGGCLMTELKCSDRSAAPLLSETVITDGQWHRLGFVWDSSYRTLYVDDIAVAEDVEAQEGDLRGTSGGLYIGAGMNTDPGSLFCGLIDEVRIYNRAVRP